MKDLKKFDENNYAKLAPELFKNNVRMNLSLHGQKLLFGLTCSLSDDIEAFPSWHIHISDLFKYLNIENSNKRYDIVRKALSELMKNPLEIIKSSKDWIYISWLTTLRFSEEKSNYVEIRFNEQAAPYLLNLKKYCLLETKYYVKFESSYAMILYPRLRNIANQKQPILELTFDDILKLTYNEKTDAYQKGKNRNANNDILKRIIGIQKKRGSKHWLPLSSIDKKTGAIVETGAIAEINALSDLYVTCDVKAKGRAYHSVIFTVQFKTETFQGKRKQIRKLHRTDFRNSDLKDQRITEIKQGELQFGIPLETIELLAKTKGISTNELLRQEGYRLSSDGLIALKI